ncbi:hypothetical protein HYU23_03465 [Candidatus Woesearchaeota archaeon]|nr:hypothetical protein [Candidatus Woesearchaeota archaeon]
MPIVGFNFDKISVEKKSSLSKEDKIQNNVNVRDIKESKLKIDKNEVKSLKIEFDFSVDYSKAGNLQLLGNLIYLENEPKISELLNMWDKDKKMQTEFGAQIYNFIINRCSIKALQLEEDVGLPLHIILPKVKPKNK